MDSKMGIYRSHGFQSGFQEVLFKLENTLKYEERVVKKKDVEYYPILARIVVVQARPIQETAWEAWRVQQTTLDTARKSAQYYHSSTYKIQNTVTVKNKSTLNFKVSTSLNPAYVRVSCHN